LAYLLRKSKNCDKEESGKRILGLMTGRKKEGHFFGKGCCKNLWREAAKKKEIEKG